MNFEQQYHKAVEIIDLRFMKIEHWYKQYFECLKLMNMSHYIEPFKLKYKLKIEGLESEIKDLMTKENSRENEVKIRIAQSLLTTYNDLYKKLILWSYNEPKRIEKNRKMKIKQELEQIL